MSLRIPGAPPPPTPAVRRTEPVRRPTANAAETPAALQTPAATSMASLPTSVSAPAVEAKVDQWVARENTSSPLPDPVAAPDGGAASAAPGLAADQAQLAAARMGADVLAQPQQASRAHGNLVAATVLNLLV